MKWFLSPRQAVTPFLYGHAGVTRESSEVRDGATEVDVEGTRALVRGAVGLEWFASARFSLGANVGARWRSGEMGRESAQPGLREALNRSFLEIFTSGSRPPSTSDAFPLSRPLRILQAFSGPMEQERDRAMSEIPQGLYYTEEHEYLRETDEPGVYIVGITDYAQGELGDVVFVELPALGESFGKMETFGTIEAVKAVSDLYCPVRGSVVQVNHALDDDPSLVNSDPYGAGWMIRLRVADPSEVTDLLDAGAYADHVGA